MLCCNLKHLAQLRRLCCPRKCPETQQLLSPWRFSVFHASRCWNLWSGKMGSCCDAWSCRLVKCHRSSSQSLISRHHPSWSHYRYTVPQPIYRLFCRPRDHRQRIVWDRRHPLSLLRRQLSRSSSLDWSRLISDSRLRLLLTRCYAKIHMLTT